MAVAQVLPWAFSMEGIKRTETNMRVTVFKKGYQHLLLINRIKT